MEFLKNNGFNDKQIEDILNKYDEDTLDTFVFNQDNVIEVIKYLRDYGIKDIPKLMLERIDLFYFPVEKIDEMFSKYEKDSVIATLDYDSTMLDEMF